MICENQIMSIDPQRMQANFQFHRECECLNCPISSILSSTQRRKGWVAVYPIPISCCPSWPVTKRTSFYTRKWRTRQAFGESTAAWVIVRRWRCWMKINSKGVDDVTSCETRCWWASVCSLIRKITWTWWMCDTYVFSTFVILSPHRFWAPERWINGFCVASRVVWHLLASP